MEIVEGHYFGPLKFLSNSVDRSVGRGLGKFSGRERKMWVKGNSLKDGNRTGKGE